MSVYKIREFSTRMYPTEQFIYTCPLLLNGSVIERLEKAGILPLTSFPGFQRAIQRFPLATSERLCLEFALSLDGNPKYKVAINGIRGTIGDEPTLRHMAKWLMSKSPIW